MKKKATYRITILLIFFISAFKSFAQDIINREAPITSIDYGVSENSNLYFKIILNNNDKTANVNPTVQGLGITATIEGKIVWTTPVSDPNENTFKGTFTIGSGPFEYLADVKNGNGKFIAKQDFPKIKWFDGVIVKINSSGTYYQTIQYKFYPPTNIEVKVDDPKLEVQPGAIMKSKNDGEVSFISNPKGRRYEVTKITIYKQSKNGVETTEVEGEDLGPDRFANNGFITIPFKCSFGLGEQDVMYHVIGVAKLLDNDKEIITTKTPIIFSDQTPLSILNRDNTYKIVIENQDTLCDCNINTTGKGVLGIEFLGEFKNKITVAPPEISGNVYSFKLSGLQRISDESQSVFYYTVNGIKMQQAYVIVKKKLELTNFKIDGTNGNQITLKYNLPKYINPNDITISLNGEKSINIQGSSITKKDDSGNFTSVLPKEIISFISKDTILNLIIGVHYIDKPLYSVEMSFVNQKLINQKFAALTEEIAKRPGQRNKRIIEQVVKDINTISKALGNTSGDGEVTTAVQNLTDSNSSNIANGMQKVSNWLTIAGKLIVPILAAI